MSIQKLLEIITSKVPLSPNVTQAFGQVDRAIFVPERYRRPGTEWILGPTGSSVYEDCALTTQVMNNLPSSSSSQPSVMALMLEALDVQPGHRVLEIGTGTGYNAALLACLVGEYGHVVSVEIDEELCTRARRNIDGAGYTERVTVVQADGRKSIVETSSFDRLILTAGFCCLETAWVQQLQLKGLLVGNLKGKIFSVLLKLQKDGQHTMSGHLLSQSVYFMDIHGEEYPSMNAPDWQKYDALQVHRIEPDPDMLKTLTSQAFLFFLGGQSPHMQLHMRALGTPKRYEICKVFLADESSATIHENGYVDVRGNIWSRIEKAYGLYKQLGSPSLDDYCLAMEMNQNLSARIGTECWSISA